ncbi:hypothetical protein OH77DRAFT_1084938 [Trametes cingulata]|nr:hypothetical protein OH77DRAFT_1084938 [Trametes cingulata]
MQFSSGAGPWLRSVTCCLPARIEHRRLRPRRKTLGTYLWYGGISAHLQIPVAHPTVAAPLLARNHELKSASRITNRFGKSQTLGANVHNGATALVLARRLGHLVALSPTPFPDYPRRDSRVRHRHSAQHERMGHTVWEQRQINVPHRRGVAEQGAR